MNMPTVTDPDSVLVEWDADDKNILLTWTQDDIVRQTVLLSPEAAGAVAGHIHRLFLAEAEELDEKHWEFPSGTLDIDGPRTILTLPT